MWHELNYHQDFQAGCATDSTNFKKLDDKTRVYDFLVALNLEYDPNRIQILDKDHFPTLMQAYSQVQGEESRRSAILHIPSQDRSGLMTTPENDIKTEKIQREDKLGDTKKRMRKCDHWERMGTLKKSVRSYMVVLSKAVGWTKSHAYMTKVRGLSSIP